MRNFDGRREFLVGALALSLAACSAVQGRETAGQYVDDTTITTKVKAALLRDEGLKGHQVNVETMEGTVQLSGFVDSAQQAARAAELARGVEGVKSVRNSIVVRGS
jgi:hyperosmotically inducible periplasmic protein